MSRRREGEGWWSARASARSVKVCRGATRHRILATAAQLEQGRRRWSKGRAGNSPEPNNRAERATAANGRPRSRDTTRQDPAESPLGRWGCPCWIKYGGGDSFWCGIPVGGRKTREAMSLGRGGGSVVVGGMCNVKPGQGASVDVVISFSLFSEQLLGKGCVRCGG